MFALYLGQAKRKQISVLSVSLCAVRERGRRGGGGGGREQEKKTDTERLHREVERVTVCIKQLTVANHTYTRLRH